MDYVRRDAIRDVMTDMVAKLLYYDRKEDAILPAGAIEQAIVDGDITANEIVGLFRDKLKEGLGVA